MDKLNHDCQQNPRQILKSKQKSKAKSISKLKIKTQNQQSKSISTFQAIESLNQLVRMIGSSALDDKILTDPNVISAIHTFSALSFDSLKDVYSTIEDSEELR